MKRPRAAWLAIIVSLATGPSVLAADAAVLRRGAFAEPETLEPNQSGVASEAVILSDLFEGLTTHAADGSILAGAAHSWRPSADGRRYTFLLRPDLRWSDGRPLTAEDWVYSLRRILTPATAAAKATSLYLLRNARAVHLGQRPPAELGVHAPNRATLIVDLEHPAPYLPWLFAGEQGFPLPRHAIEAHGAKWTRAGNHVSNGAFMLAERKVRGAVRLVRNRYFHAAGSVRLDAVVYYPSDDTMSLVNRFRAGELDVNGWPGFPVQRQTLLRNEHGSAAHVAPLASVRYLRFNVRRAPFDDVRLRLALSLAIDREALIRHVMSGGERLSVRPAPGGLPGDLAPSPNPLLTATYAQRLARAKELLATVRLRERRAEPVRLRLPSGNGEAMCLAVAAMWSAAGAPTKLEKSEIKSLVADLRRGNFDVALTGAQDIPVVDAYLERFRASASYNTGRYESPAFESALDAAEAIAHPAARAAALARAELLLINDHAIVPLIEEVARNLVSARVRGWVDNPYDIHLSRYLSLQ